MQVEIIPSEGSDHLLPGYRYNGGQIRIINSTSTDADTLEEAILTQLDHLPDEFRLHFQIEEIIFRDFASSGYNDPVPTVTESLSGGEFLVRTVNMSSDYVKYDPIPIYGNAGNADVGEYKIKSLELELIGILTPDQDYLPIEECFNTNTKISDK
jgi:hypothetical protein